MNNTQCKSVSASSTKSKGSKSKASGQRQTRQESYRKKFGNRPHMIIPIEDAEFIETQKPSVVQLWLASWRSDPYGSRWQKLNHNLSYSAFKKAKKILIAQGLFEFKTESSMRDNRETAYWSVMNLHGARRTDYWLDNSSKKDSSLENKKETSKKECFSKNKPKNSKKCQDSTGACQDSTGAWQDSTEACQDLYKASIESESLTEQSIQTPSETSQEHLRNSSKEFLEVLPNPYGVSDSDRDNAFKERVTSATPTKKNAEAQEKDLGFVTKPNQNSKQVNQSTEDEPKVLTKKSTNSDKKPYVENRYSEDSVKRSKEQNLSIDEERKTKEYQDTFKAGAAKIRAKLEGIRKRNFEERRANLRGNSPMTFEDRRALEEYGAEIQKRFKEQE